MNLQKIEKNFLLRLERKRNFRIFVINSINIIDKSHNKTLEIIKLISFLIVSLCVLRRCVWISNVFETSQLATF